MKNFLVFLALLIFVGCNMDDSPQITPVDIDEEPDMEVTRVEHIISQVDLDEILGTWFRSTPIRFGALHGNPAFERGESHIEVTFSSNGDFEHRYTTLGFYENQNPTDSTTIRITKGTFILENGFLNIERNSRTTIQIHDGNNINRDTFRTQYIIQHEYQWPNVQISPEDSLEFTYHTITDEVDPEQISPGIELREEVYERK